ncbi:MAG: ABC transporter ATP-binding protein [Cellulomonadaceae bacterium]|jgi:putative ABC transport system ATP-binding protein|nr:ABC transporter ATP-binding protein [Cellulomonadaceae bacterium]
MDAPFIRLHNVIKRYDSPGGVSVVALNQVSFDIRKGDLVVIVGPSGAGKTTLLNLLGGMDTATSGNMWVGGSEVSSLTEKQLTEYRRHDVGFVFQFYNLMPNLTALENVQLATEICRNPHPAAEILAGVGLRGREGSFPAQLSGGEQQRVSIARAVAKNSHILLCDEPTGALDYETGKQILALLRDVCDTLGTTVIIVTHNSALKAMADTVITVKNGQASSVVRNEHPTPIAEIEW